MDKELEIEISKKYNIPQNIVKKTVDDKMLIISVDTANWLLIMNKEQELIFDMLLTDTIETIISYIEDNNLNIENLIYVLTEIEAKKFEQAKIFKQNNDVICIYLTNKCNLRCRHCYMFSAEEEEDELKTDEVIKLLTSFKENSGKSIILTGGEVTERQDFKEIVIHAKKIGLNTTVLSNGTNWSDELITSLYDKIDEVQISVDGYDEDSNAKIRGKGNFDLALDTIDKLFSLNVTVTVAIAPIMPIDKYEYIKFGKYLSSKYKRDNFHIKYNYEMIAGRDEHITNINNDEYSAIIKEIVEQVYPNSRILNFAVNHKGSYLFNNCGYGGITIASNGEIYFCNRVSELNSYGNIRNLDYKVVSEMATKVHNISNVDNLVPCKNCDLKYICGGGCRIAYVPEVTRSTDLDTNNEYTRQCNDSEKMSIYRKMIDSNELFYD